MDLTWRTESLITIGVFIGVVVGGVILALASQQQNQRVAKPEKKTESSPPIQRTFRLTGISPDISLIRLRQMLQMRSEANDSKNDGTRCDTVLKASLTESATAQDRSLVATVCVTALPQYLHDQLTPGVEYVDRPIQLCLENTCQTVHIDNHFFGMTPLYWHPDWVVDIVAVTGWNAKAFVSWKPRHTTDMWLRDWLGQDLALSNCPARILTYGYSSELANSTSDASLHDYGLGLFQALKSIRRSQVKALKLASSSVHILDRDIYQSCVGIFMFGVPNLGLENTALLNMTYGQKNDTFARDLGIGSQYLEELERNFCIAIRDQMISVIAICELEDSPSVQQKGTVWARTGPLVRMVSKGSAWECGPSPKRWSRKSNHSYLVKFSRHDDSTYVEVQHEILRMVEEKPDHISPERTDISHSTSQDIKYISVPAIQGACLIRQEYYLGLIEKTFLSPTLSNVFVLSGIGGVGKTEIALSFIDTRSELYSKVFWIQADSKEKIVQSFREAANLLGASDVTENLFQRVFSNLRNSGRKVLLVYDNLDDIQIRDEILNHHRPDWREDSFHILITSRDKELSSLSSTHSSAEVGVFNPGQAMTLMTTLLEGSSDSAQNTPGSLSNLCHALGYLPLAINQASCHIKVRGVQAKHYLSELEQTPRRVLSWGSQWTPYKKPVFKVWETSIVYIEDNNQYASDWFHMTSFLDRTIPHSMFQLAQAYCQRQSRYHVVCPSQSLKWLYETSPGESWSIPLMEIQINHLQRLSLINLDYSQGETATTNFHPLVQTWARTRLKPAQQISFLAMACTMIYACAEELRLRQNASRDSIAAYMSQQTLFVHAQACVEFAEKTLERNIATILAPECTLTFALFYINERRYQGAMAMLPTVLERHSGPPNITLNTARRLLSLAFRRADRLEEAEATQEVAIHELEELVRCRETGTTKQLNEIKGELLRAKAELATIYRDMKKFTTAYEVQSSVVQQAKDLLGAESLETLHEMSCFGTILNRSERLEEAEKLERQVVDIYERKYPGRPEILDKKRNLAITLYCLSRYDEAIALEHEVLRGKQELYGDEHIEVAAAMQNLGTSYKDSGQYKKAAQWYSQALAIRRRVLGESHRATKKTDANLREAKALQVAVEAYSQRLELADVLRFQQSSLQQVLDITSGTGMLSSASKESTRSETRLYANIISQIVAEMKIRDDTSTIPLPITKVFEQSIKFGRPQISNADNQRRYYSGSLGHCITEILDGLNELDGPRNILVNYPIEAGYLRSNISDEIWQKANGMFLWASLVVKDLAQATSLADVERLSECPPGLQAMYRNFTSRGSFLHDELWLRTLCAGLEAEIMALLSTPEVRQRRLFQMPFKHDDQFPFQKIFRMQKDLETWSAARCCISAEVEPPGINTDWSMDILELLEGKP
ncbi:hypothetical protein F4803DRAFT_546437 [Xylaria telfairii]|nr:hypothetical protein F4803DRAFT_546437 [Xylaria telfairii]